MAEQRGVRGEVEKRIRKAVSARTPMKRNLIVRMTDDLYEDIEELAQRMTDEMPGKRVTVSDVARIILEHGVRIKKSMPQKREEGI